jgi:ABC-type multidrug transport system ATPase subunit
MLEVKNISKSFRGLRAVRDASFTVAEGDINGLIGPNGAGKTTLLEAIAGLVPADGGHVLWRGNSPPLSQRRELMFYLPDGLRPWEDEYVARLLEFFAAAYDRPARITTEAIGALGLAPVLRQRLGAVSKGYGRRLMLALALIAPQPLLLMDEPFDGFDLRQTREVMGVVREVARNGRTLVLAIHQLIDAERVCDRFVLLADGRIRGIGTLADLRAQTGMPAGGLEDVFLALT